MLAREGKRDGRYCYDMDGYGGKAVRDVKIKKLDFLSLLSRHQLTMHGPPLFNVRAEENQTNYKTNSRFGS